MTEMGATASAMMNSKLSPAIGIGCRQVIGDWTRENLPHFDVLEITLDHCIASSRCASAILDLVGGIPLTAWHRAFDRHRRRAA
jgi:hypothetical protein